MVLNEGHLFLPQPHGQGFCPAVAQSDKMGESVTGHLAPSDRLETQPVAIEAFGAVEVRNSDQYAGDFDDTGSQGRGHDSP